MRGALVEIVARVADTLATVTLRLASVDDSRICHLDDKTWFPTVRKLPKLAYDLFSGDFDGAIATPSSSLTFGIDPWPNAPALRFASAPVRIWTGEVGEPFANWKLRFDGRVTAQPGFDAGVATATIAVDDAWLDDPVLGTYAGTTSAEGPADLKGTPKPLALGTPRYVSGVLIDTANTVVQISAAGPIRAVDAAMDKLSRFPPATADYPTHAALVAATIPAGRFATCLAEGKVRHGAPPLGQLSYLVRGDTGGRTDGLPRLPGELITRIAEIVGKADRVDTVSLAALDALRPMPQSIYVSTQTTARQLIQRIAQSVNCVAGVSWLGKLFVARVGVLGDTAAVLKPDGTALPPVSSVKQVENGTPWWRVDIKAQPTWTVHALADIAFQANLTDRGRFVAGTTYREGDIVDLADQSRYLYTSLTPSTSAPPSNAWRQLSPAIGTADLTYANGDSLEDFKPAVPGADKTADTPQGQAADAALKPDGTVKDNKVPTAAIQTSATQKIAFTRLTSPLQVPRLSTTTVMTFSALKDRDDSIVEVMAYLSAFSTDDLTFYMRIFIDGQLSNEGRTHNIGQGSNAGATITAFAMQDGLAAGPHTYRLEVYNYEGDAAYLTLAAGGIMKVTEMKVF